MRVFKGDKNECQTKLDALHRIVGGDRASLFKAVDACSRPSTIKQHGGNSPFAGMWENTATGELFETLPTDEAFVESFKSSMADQRGSKALARALAGVVVEKYQAETAGVRPWARTKASDEPRVIASYEKPTTAPPVVDARTLEMWRKWSPALYDENFLSVLKLALGEEFNADQFVADCARALIDLDSTGHLGLTHDRIDKLVLALINDKPLLQLKKSRRDGGGTGGAPASTGIRPWARPGTRTSGSRWAVVHRPV